MKLRLAAWALATSLAVPAAAWAQAPAASSAARAPDEAARAAARQLGERLNFAGQAQGILTSLRNQIAVGLARTSGKSPEEAGRGVDELLMPDINAAGPELSTLIVDAWASTFTAEELRELQRFYATPTGAKLTHSIGGLNQLVAASSRVLLQNVIQRTMQAHDGDLRARGLKN